VDDMPHFGQALLSLWTQKPVGIRNDSDPHLRQRPGLLDVTVNDNDTPNDLGRSL
jgi:hypothetical protein